MSREAEHPHCREELQLPDPAVLVSSLAVCVSDPAVRVSRLVVVAAVTARERGCVFQGKRMEQNAPRQLELGLFICESLSYCVMIAHIILCKWMF